MEIQEDLSRTAMLSWWYENVCFSPFRILYSLLVGCAHLIQYLLFSILRLTLRKTWIWLADQVSSWLSMLDFVFVCASDLTCCSRATDVSLCLLSVFWWLQIPQRCQNRWEACSPSVLHLCLTINITAASLHQGAVLTRDTAHYSCITQFRPGWWEWYERVLSSYMQINRAVWDSPTLPLYN